jgi:hypothetical protein
MCEKAILPQKFFTPITVWRDEAGELQICQSPGHYVCVDRIPELIEALRRCHEMDMSDVAAAEARAAKQSEHRDHQGF